MKSIAPSYERLLVICCLVTFAYYVGSYMRIPVVPLFAGSLGASASEVGIINSSFLLMAGLLSLPLGILSDRLGRMPLLVSGLLISSATSFFLYVAQTPLQMIWIYLFFGAGLAAFAPTMMSFVADFSPSTHLGRSYGWYTMALYGGMSLGPAAGGFTAQHFGFREVFFISGIFILVMILVAVLFLPKERSIAQRPSKQRLSVVGGQLMRNRSLWACWLATLGGCFGLGMFVTFAPLHAHNQGLNVGKIGFVFASQALMNALSRIPFGHLADRVVHRGNLVIAGLVGFAASMVGFGISSSVAHFTFSAVALGVSMAVAFTALGALISEVVPHEQRGLAMGGYNTCIYLGMMLSSLIMGIVVGRIGFQAGFYLTAAITLLTNAVFYLLIKDRLSPKTIPAGEQH